MNKIIWIFFAILSFLSFLSVYLNSYTIVGIILMSFFLFRKKLISICIKHIEDNNKLFTLNVIEKIDESDILNKQEFNNELINIISGINHEVSPWIGSINNITDALELDIEHIYYASNTDSISLKGCIYHYTSEIKKATKQSIDILSSISLGIKKFRNYAIFSANLKDTFLTWLFVIIYNAQFKGKITKKNIVIDYKSLDFEVIHSQMLLSQIMINLVKNTLEHNTDIDPEKIIIKISGDPSSKKVIYQDNGRGIHPANKIKVCEGIMSTKKEGISGIGMASVHSYCKKMRCTIHEEGEYTKGVKFVITFESNKASSSGGYYNLDVNKIEELGGR